MHCPYCEDSMELIAQYPELDDVDNDYYWECFSCGCRIPVNPSKEELREYFEEVCD